MEGVKTVSFTRGLFAASFVAIVLTLFIHLRADELLATYGMSEGFLAPRTRFDVYRIGLSLWVPLTFLLSITAGLLYNFVSVRWGWGPIRFVLLSLVPVAIIGILATIMSMPFAPEILGELFIIVAGFGLFIPRWKLRAATSRL